MPATTQLLGDFKILAQESEKFAELSGDSNPMHLNPDEARRLSFGGTVVHGIHACLRAIDIYLSGNSADGMTITHLSVSFDSPIRTGTTATVRLGRRDESRIKLAVYVKDERCLMINIGLAPGTLPQSPPIERDGPSDMACKPTDIEDRDQVCGELPVYLDPRRAADLFPHFRNLLTDLQVSQILATTRLIGMECPGLRSVYSGCKLKFSSVEAAERPGLSYSVASFDGRFRLARLKIKSAGLEGSLEAFVRPEPVRQASFRTALDMVRADDFKAECAIVIGGSRGLGEISAKILAAGGADVIITYRVGKQDANRVAGEINAEGGRCRAICFDITRPPADAPAALRDGQPITQLYYFATPHIETNPHEWNDEIFANFREYFVDGFERTICTLDQRWHCCASRLNVFYPSTVFLDTNEPGLAEYIAAKAAGEAVCSSDGRFPQHIKIFTLRLPRMLTDQTNTIIESATDEPLPVMRDAILKFMEYMRHAG